MNPAFEFNLDPDGSRTQLETLELARCSCCRADYGEEVQALEIKNLPDLAAVELTMGKRFKPLRYWKNLPDLAAIELTMGKRFQPLIPWKLT